MILQKWEQNNLLSLLQAEEVANAQIVNRPNDEGRKKALGFFIKNKNSDLKMQTIEIHSCVMPKLYRVIYKQ